ncbi:MAG: SRPBCC domain-containing protein [Pyrobaculum sp.]
MHVSEEGDFFVAKPPGEVVGLLKNPELVAKLIPGVGAVSKSGDEYVGEAAVKLGHLSGKMAVRFRYAKVSDDGVEVVGRATGLQTTADFTISVKAEPKDGGSLVRWRFEGEARGLIASLAPSIVQSALKKMASEAAQNLAKALGQ